MPELPTLTLFLLTAWLLLITPGPAIFYIVARSIDQGRIAGIVSALGVAFGTLFHIGAAALGLSALLASSALAFTIVKYLGAAYLIYLGVRKLLDRDEPVRPPVLERVALKRIFVQGAVVNVLNPKTALFFLAFLPQFVDVARGSVALQIIVLGAMFVALGIISDGLWALLAGGAGNWLRSKLRFVRAQRYFAGSVYIGLGVATALSGSGKRGD